MGDGADELVWPRRVRKARVRRLYELDAAGIVDDELVNEVGWALHARCDAIVTIEEARRGRIRCPRCWSNGVSSHIEREGDRDTPFTCPNCGWGATWREFLRTTKRRQLCSGGALPAFREFLAEFPKARGPRRRMLAIDRLIHAFHYTLTGQANTPTRAAGVNLIEGRLTDVLAFLGKLAYSDRSSPGTREVLEGWRRARDAMPWYRVDTSENG
jgi:predicted RNA-binding Zn-ribbon protein involved in translation (DUF1610 family)